MGGVFANGLEISGKAVEAQTIAAFPDTCFTPPENPATPPGVPVPYPSFGFSSDTEKGTGTVFIIRETVNIRNRSHLSKTSGTEAGCATRKGIVSSKNTSISYFHKWSNNVKFDGEPVVRHSDLATNNHGSPDSNSMLWLHRANSDFSIDPASDNEPACPCCKGPAHDHQKTSYGKLKEPITAFEFYTAIKRKVQRTKNINMTTEKRKEVREAWSRLTKDNFQGCPNVRNSKEGCAAHFKPTKAISKYFNVSDRHGAEVKMGLNADRRDAIRIDRYNLIFQHKSLQTEIARYHKLPKKGELNRVIKYLEKLRAAKLELVAGNGQGKLNHITPLTGGGCALEGNIITNLELERLSEQCQEAEKYQTTLQAYSHYLYE